MRFQTREEYKRHLVKELCFTPDEAEQYIDKEEMQKKDFNHEQEIIKIDIDKKEGIRYE